MRAQLRPSGTADPANVPRGTVAGDLRLRWTDGRREERWCYIIGVLLIASGLVHLGVYTVLGGPWQGPVSWRKPVTFGLSFGVTLLTITWVASFLTLGPRPRKFWLSLFATACCGEVCLVTIQAWRRVPSHFNLSTPLDTLIARTLAAGGAVLIIVIVALTFISFRANETLAPSMCLAIRVGFLTLLFALLVGAVMITIGLAEVFAGQQQAAYSSATSLKPAHAATMHGILALPALAWLLGHTDWQESQRVRLVWTAVVGYIFLAGVVVARAFAGSALNRAPLIAVVLAALGTVVLCVAGLLVVATRIRTARRAL